MSENEVAPQLPAATRLLPLLVVFCAVLLQLVGAVVLKELATRSLPWIMIGTGLGAVILLNALRFVVWGYAHSRFPLSKTYLLSSIFFPLMLVISWLYGDAVGPSQLSGTALIAVGVIWLTSRVS